MLRSSTARTDKGPGGEQRLMKGRLSPGQPVLDDHPRWLLRAPSRSTGLAQKGEHLQRTPRPRPTCRGMRELRHVRHPGARARRNANATHNG